MACKSGLSVMPKNAYFYNAWIYSGKENGVAETNQGEKVVKKFSIPILKSGRIIIMDNFFTPLPLARYLLEQKLTMVGTVRKTKRFLPNEFQSPKGEKAQQNFSSKAKSP